MVPLVGLDWIGGVRQAVPLGALYLRPSPLALVGCPLVGGLPNRSLTVPFDAIPVGYKRDVWLAGYYVVVNFTIPFNSIREPWYKKGKCA